MYPGTVQVKRRSRGSSLCREMSSSNVPDDSHNVSGVNRIAKLITKIRMMKVMGKEVSDGEVAFTTKC